MPIAGIDLNFGCGAENTINYVLIKYQCKENANSIFSPKKLTLSKKYGVRYYLPQKNCKENGKLALNDTINELKYNGDFYNGHHNGRKCTSKTSC